MLKTNSKIEDLLEQILKEIRAENNQSNMQDKEYSISSIGPGSRICLLPPYRCFRIVNQEGADGIDGFGEYQGFSTYLSDKKIKINIYGCSDVLHSKGYVTIDEILYVKTDKSGMMILGITVRCRTR